MGMGVTIMPQWGPQLGEALAGLIPAVKNIAEPNFTFKRQLERELLTNPELAQHVGDIEYSNPGSITANFGHLLTPAASDVLRSTAPSMNARIARILRENPNAMMPEMQDEMVRRAMTGEGTFEAARGEAAKQFISTAEPSDVADVGAAELAPWLIRTRSNERIAANRIGPDSPAMLQAQASLMRAMTAETPQQRLQARMQFAQYAARLGLDNRLQEIDYAEAQRAPREAVQYQNAIRAENGSIASYINRYNASGTTAQEKQQLASSIQQSIMNINQLRGYMGAQPLGYTVGEGTSGLFGQNKRLQFFNEGGQPTNLIPDELAVPSYQDGHARGSNPPPVPAHVQAARDRAAASQTTFSSAESAMIDTAVQAARTPHDIANAQSLTPAQKTEAIRRFGARRRSR